MAEWHLRQLESRLLERGWRVTNVRAGDGYGISASWEIERGAGERHVLDFEGLAESGVALPLEEAYGCHVRGATAGAYFGKRPSDRRPRGSWDDELRALVTSLEEA